MQYVKPFPQRKLNFSLEVETFLLIFSGYNFDIINTLLEFEASRMTASRLYVKPYKISIN